MSQLTLYGNPALHDFLHTAAATKKVPQALLIEGAKGLGKKTFAGEIARVLFCQGDGLPSCGCSACVKLARNSHPDLFYIAEEKDGDAGVLVPRPISAESVMKQLSVSTIRKISAHAPILPNEAPSKLYAVDCTFGISKEAQNAFLKILEEPPAFVQFILLSNSRSDLLDTILSRVQVLPVLPLNRADFFLAAQARELNEGAAEGLFLLSEGNFGEALSLSEPMDDPMVVLSLDFFQGFVSGKAWEILLLMEQFSDFAGKDRQKLYNLFAFLRKMCYLSFAAATLDTRQFPPFCGAALEALAAWGPSKIGALLAVIETAMEQIDANVTFPACLTAFSAGLHTIFAYDA